MYLEHALPAAEILVDIGAELRERREDLGVSQRELAARLDTCQMQVWRVENGSQARASLKVIMAHASALGLNTIITFEERKSPHGD